MTTPLYLALGGPKPAQVAHDLPDLLPAYAGFSTGMDASDPLSNNFASIDTYLPLLAANQSWLAEVNVSTDTSQEYQVVTVPDTVGDHGGDAKQITAVIPFCPLAISDKVEACQDLMDHCDIIGMPRPISLGMTVGSATGELRYYWGSAAGLAEYQKSYPGATLADLRQMAIDARVDLARQLAAMLTTGGYLRSTYLDPGSLGGSHDDAAYAISDAQAIADMLGKEFPGITHVAVYESLETGRPVPAFYSKFPGPLGFQAKVGSLPEAPEGAVFLELHIEDVKKGSAK